MTVPVQLPTYESCILPKDALRILFKRSFELEAYDPSG